MGNTKTRLQRLGFANWRAEIERAYARGDDRAVSALLRSAPDDWLVRVIGETRQADDATWAAVPDDVLGRIVDGAASLRELETWGLL